MADSGFHIPSVTVSEVDGNPKRRPIQELVFSNGTVTITGNKATIVTSGSTDIGTILASGTVGSILFIGAGPAIAQNNASLFWNDSTAILTTKALTLNATSGNILIVDTPTLVIDATNHRVGVGTVSPLTPLYLTGAHFITTADGQTQFSGAAFEYTTTDTSTTAFRYGYFTIAANLASNPASNKVMVGMFGSAITPTGLTTNLTNVSLRGLNSSATHNGTGTLKDAWGGNYGATNVSTGTITNLTGVRSVSGNANASGVITTFKAFEAAAFVNNGTMVNTYGFYCGIQTSGTQTNTPYAFYNADQDAVNYFAGATVPRVTDAGSVSSASYSLSVDSRYCNIIQLIHTGSSTTITIADDSGVVSPKPYNGQPLTFKIKCTNSQTFSWNARYVGGDVALPTSHTGGSLWRYYSFLYDTGAAKWHYTGTSGGF